METFSRPGIGVGAEQPKSAAARVQAPVNGSGPSFDSLFQAATAEKPAAPTAPPSAGAPLVQFPLKTTTTTQLIYSLMGKAPAPAAKIGDSQQFQREASRLGGASSTEIGDCPQFSPPLPPALAAPVAPALNPTATVNGKTPDGFPNRRAGNSFVGTGVHRMDDLRTKMQRMNAPPSTLDIKVTSTNSHEVKRMPKQQALGRVTGAAVSKRIAAFRNGTLSWGELESYGKAAADHAERVIARLSARDAFHGTDRNRPVMEALDTLAEALRQLSAGAKALDNGTVDAAELVAQESDASLKQARITHAA